MFERLFAFVRGPKQSLPPAEVLSLPAPEVPRLREVRPELPRIVVRNHPDPARKSPKQQARMLLKYLLENGITGEHRPDDMKDFYVDMCIDEYLHIHHWNVVAKEFTKLTTKKKVYRWITDEKGIKHRLRVYPVTGTVVPLRRAA